LSGFIQTTEALGDDSSSDESTKDRSVSPLQHMDEEAIKSGYGVKQGVFVSRQTEFQILLNVLKLGAECIGV